MKYTVFKMIELYIKYTWTFICRFLHLEKSLWVIEFLIGQKSFNSWHIGRHMVTIGLMNTNHVSGGFIWSSDSFSLKESMLLLRFKILHPCLLFYNIVFWTIIFFNSCLHRSLLVKLFSPVKNAFFLPNKIIKPEYFWKKSYYNYRNVRKKSERKCARSKRKTVSFNKNINSTLLRWQTFNE